MEELSPANPTVERTETAKSAVPPLTFLTLCGKTHRIYRLKGREVP